MESAAGVSTDYCGSNLFCMRKAALKRHKELSKVEITLAGQIT